MIDDNEEEEEEEEEEEGNELEAPPSPSASPIPSPALEETQKHRPTTLNLTAPGTQVRVGAAGRALRPPRVSAPHAPGPAEEERGLCGVQRGKGLRRGWLCPGGGLRAAPTLGRWAPGAPAGREGQRWCWLQLRSGRAELGMLGMGLCGACVLPAGPWPRGSGGPHPHVRGERGVRDVSGWRRAAGGCWLWAQRVSRASPARHTCVRMGAGAGVRVQGCLCAPCPSFSIPGAGLQGSPGVGGPPAGVALQGCPCVPARTRVRCRPCAAAPPQCVGSRVRCCLHPAALPWCRGAFRILGPPPGRAPHAAGAGEAVGGLGVLARPAQEGDKAPGPSPRACQPRCTAPRWDALEKPDPAGHPGPLSLRA